MDREHIAISGAPGSPDFRVELDLLTDPPALDQLHDDRVGNSARVFGGQLRVRGSVIPVAVKVQRDQALNGESHPTVAAKFTREQTAHLRLQHDTETEPGADIPFPRMFPLSADAPRADELPPSFLCRHASGALTPRCSQPDCRGVALGFIDQDADPRLQCPKCNFAYRVLYTAPEQARELKERMFQATLGNDSACAECRHRDAAPGACRAHAVPLNYSPARVLVSERLDLDLSDYLAWSRATAPVRRNRAWARYVEHRSVLGEPLAWLQTVCDLASQLARAVQAMHACAIAHIDLKPENLCLQLRPGGVALKVIDLGLAEDQHAAAYIRQAAGPTRLETEFAAPEVARPSVAGSNAVGAPGANGAVAIAVTLPGTLVTDRQDPPVVRGDLADFGNGRDARVSDVRPGATAIAPWVLTLERDSPPQIAPRGNVTIYKTIDRAADVYSFGVILLALLHRESNLPGARRVVESLASATQTVSNPGAVPPRALAARIDPQSAAGSLYQALQWYREYRHLAEELFGVAILCVVRARGYYVESRGDDTKRALARLTADLGRAAHAVRSATDLARADRLRAAPIQRIDAWLSVTEGPRPKGTISVPKQAIRHLLQALPFAGADAEAEQRELAHLRTSYATDLMSALLAARRQLAPPPPAPAPPPPPVAPAPSRSFVLGGELIRFLRYAVPHDRDPACQLRFLKEHSRRVYDPNASAAASVPEWLTRYSAFAAVVREAHKHAQVIDRFVGGTDAVFLAPLAHALANGRARAGWVELGVEVYECFDPEQVFAAADLFEAITDRVHGELLPDLLKEWRGALDHWQRSDNPLQKPLAALKSRSQAHLEQVQTTHDKWYEHTRSALASVRAYATDLQEALFPVWDGARASRGWLFGRRFDRFAVGAELLNLRTNTYGDPMPAAEELLADLLGPYGTVQAGIALVELQGLDG